jgi:hypothetical protein
MKTKQIFAVLTILSIVLFASMSRAADITATGSGNWSSTVTNAPWPDGIVPNPTNDDVDVEAPYVITVDSYAQIQYIYGSGTVVMAPGSTLNVVGDSAGAQGTYQLAVLDTSATGNTVIYSGNSFWAKHQNYYNLVFNNGTTNIYNFYNGYANSQDPAFAMTIVGDMSVLSGAGGKVKVQQGADITVGGNLIIGTNSSWDCSSFNVTVTSNLTIGGLMLDADGALGINNFLGNVTINHSATGGWNLGDVVWWSVGGSLTNNGLIAGTAYASIAFNGTGNIAGSAITIPTMTINGTYTIGTKITLTTNTPTLNGTLVFDLAKTNQIVLKAGTNWLYYSGILNVINSGAPPVLGNSYKFFNATNYGGAFASTSFPILSSGLIWVDNLLTSGSIAVANGSAGSPIITLTRSGALLTLSWDSTTYPGYSVLAQTNSTGIHTNLSLWSATGSGTNSPFTIAINPTNPAVFYRLRNP